MSHTTYPQKILVESEGSHNHIINVIHELHLCLISFSLYWCYNEVGLECAISYEAPPRECDQMDANPGLLQNLQLLNMVCCLSHWQQLQLSDHKGLGPNLFQLK